MLDDVQKEGLGFSFKFWDGDGEDARFQKLLQCLAFNDLFWYRLLTVRRGKNICTNIEFLIAEILRLEPDKLRKVLWQAVESDHELGVSTDQSERLLLVEGVRLLRRRRLRDFVKLGDSCVDTDDSWESTIFSRTNQSNVNG